MGALLLAGTAALSQPLPKPPTRLVIGIDSESNTFGGRYMALSYAEMAKRLGQPIELLLLPQQRRSEMADSGAIDGETARVHGYAAAHPNLVRVEESVLDLGFELYAVNPALHLQRLEDLASGNWLGEYRRGVLFCEKTLKSVLPAERVSDVTDAAQGVQKLLAGRTDVYCDLEIAVTPALADPKVKGSDAVRRVLALGVLPTYPYLHKRHAELALRMAQVLREMKSEGLLEAYRLQAQRETGAAR